MEHIDTGIMKKTIEMVLQCCYCNEVFSENMIIQILTHITNSLSNEFKQGLFLLNEIIVIFLYAKIEFILIKVIFYSLFLFKAN